MGRKPKPRICRGCGVALTAENWNPGVQRKGEKICRACEQSVKQKRQERRAAELVQTEKQYKCIKCGVDLIVGVTAQPSSLKKGDYICRPCNLKRKRESKVIDKHCVDCGILLVVGENATATAGKFAAYTCKACSKARYQSRSIEEIVKDRQRHMRRRRRNKIELINRYGGRCACCGEIRIEFLTIDHINGGGSRERRENRQIGTQFLSKLLKQPKRDDLRVLCYNCNTSLGHYGYCPHERERNGTVKPFDDISEEEIVKRASKRI